MHGSKMKQPRRTQSRSAETREKVINAAISLMAKVGCSATTTNDIADLAGVSRGALQHHFKSRYDLIAAVLDQVMIDILNILDRFELANAPLKARIEGILNAYGATFNSPTYRASLSIYLSSSTDELLKRKVEDHLDAIHRSGEKVWWKLFGDVDLPKEEHFALRRMVIAAARGYAVLGLGDKKANWDADIQTMVALILARFGSAEKRTGITQARAVKRSKA